MANFSDKYLFHDQEMDRINNKIDRFWRGRFAEMLQFAAREDKLLPGCTMPLPVKCRVTRLPKDWPLHPATIELESGQRKKFVLKGKKFSIESC
jgi:hypothetical protein